MTRLPTFIILILSILSASGQTGNGYTIQQYNTENGLASNGIKGLQWDESTGFLWIATEAGIARFNGIDFKNFTAQNTPGITSERMTFLVKNNAGRIYTADLTGNINFINRNKLEYFGKIPPASDLYDNRITLTISDTLYNTTKNFRTRSNVSFLYSRFLPLSDTSCVIFHAGQLYWLAPGVDTLLPFSNSIVPAKGVFKINGKPLYRGVDNRFREINANRSTQEIEFDNTTIAIDRLFNQNARLFWLNGMDYPIILDRNNAWKLKFRNNKITPELICTKVPTDALIPYVQYSEKQKTLFIGTESKGIIIISEDKVMPVKSITHLPNERNAYYSQIELTDGNVLTGEGHIVGNKPSTAKPPIVAKFSNFLSITGDSLLWYSQFNSKLERPNLFKYNQKTGVTTAFPKTQGAELLIHPLPNDQWLFISESGIGHLIGDTVHFLYRHPSVNFDNTINNIIEIEPGKFLIASCSGILQFYSTRSTTTIHFNHIHSVFFPEIVIINRRIVRFIRMNQLIYIGFE